MKNLLLIIAGVFLVISVLIATQGYKEKTGQDCGEPSEVISRVNWFWQWWANRDEGRYFIACVGPSYYIVYRPLDIAGAGILLSAGIAFTAVKKRR
ncbi:MAG: hypothetical protein A2Z11_02180 [Candidatus Woykebacteria bacterium RBG_16_43_9]|uniref:Uncharacterized protein n=1 Tax=Candidatus Woykebacteria bacterium RBG_16_43_9 TaxID=1802596 RepID=A0A1G1WH41_9BACT|nr:MAG: hypothetical protein A2Z11_02180 [Candidatus Woykebacteria bacterium RBG_16_43_9]